MSKKLTCWRLYKQFHTKIVHDKYKACSSKCANAINSYVTECENKLIDKGNIGSFYRYINGKLNGSDGIGSLKDENGE